VELRSKEQARVAVRSQIPHSNALTTTVSFLTASANTITVDIQIVRRFLSLYMLSRLTGSQ
jgi:hypothetical protein